jgi:hypothetical protein
MNSAATANLPQAAPITAERIRTVERDGLPAYNGGRRLAYNLVVKGEEAEACIQRLGDEAVILLNVFTAGKGGRTRRVYVDARADMYLQVDGDIVPLGRWCKYYAPAKALMAGLRLVEA